MTGSVPPAYVTPTRVLYLLSGAVNLLLDFLLEIDRLKTVERASLIADGSRHENSAEHSWHLAMVAMALAPLAPANVDMDRVIRIQKELKEVVRTRQLQRKNRSRNETPTIALVGYTNAGKSTLFNHLTNADVLSKDMLFATLDPTLRAFTLPSGNDVVMADTVGFISQLPTELVEAFKSTLEEVVEADLLLHVHDGASDLRDEEADDVRKVLLDLGLDSAAQERRIIHVFNKSDLLADSQIVQLREAYPEAVFISAITGTGIDALHEAIAAKLTAGSRVCQFQLPPSAGDARAFLYRHGTIQSSDYDDDGTEAGIHPRWAKVYAIGDQQEDVTVGQWVMVAHGRWSRGFKVKKEGVELEVRMIDENDILLVSDDEPEQNRMQAGYVNTGGMRQMTSLPGND